MLLPAVIVLSILAYAGATPFLLPTRRLRPGDIAVGRAAYLRRVLQKERAREVSRELKTRITMPPPPPDPEAVVSETFAEALTSDVRKITGDLLDVKLQKELSDHIAATLQDELAEAARNIAEGRLSEDEIRALHKQFQEKAHAEAVVWRREYRKKHQVEIAKVSTTQWYLTRISTNLVRNLRYKLFSSRWDARMWSRIYAGTYTGWSRYPAWSDLRSNGYLTGKLKGLDALLKGPSVRYRDPKTGERKSKRHPAWPGPSREQAAYIWRTLNHIFQGHHPGTYPSPSWRSCIYGGVDKHETPTGVNSCNMSDGVLAEFYPHEPAGPARLAKELDGLWQAALSSAGAYHRAGQAGKRGGELAAAQKACVEAIAAVVRTGGKLVVSREGRGWTRDLRYASPYRTVNAVVRSQVLRSRLRVALHDRWVTSLMDALTPLVQEMAEDEFQKGIIVSRKGIDQLRRDFVEKMVPLLRRDVLKVFPKKEWDRRVFDSPYPFRSYRSKVTSEPRRWPDAKDIREEEALLAKLLSARPELKAYADKRRELLRRHFTKSVETLTEKILALALTGDILMRSWRDFAEGVDYADKVREKLDARKRAKEGRGQDLAALTAEGVPDVSAALVALLTGGAKGHGTTLVPVQAGALPGFVTRARPHSSLRLASPLWAPRPTGWGFETQVGAGKVRPDFKCRRFEAIPFLSKFPRLDGELSDWGRIRPLVLGRGRHSLKKGEAPIMVYAAWSYQGFFFAYQVRDEEEFIWPAFGHGGLSPWMGDYLRLFFDTLDARNTNRGEPHTQEFAIFPRGTELEENTPGIERAIASQRDATTKEYRGVKSSNKMFVEQPPRSMGPDGTGPYRVTSVTRGPKGRYSGYTVEAFIPRTLFKVPVFAPGWYVGFDCRVATGRQSRSWTKFVGQAWSPAGKPDNPDTWGDLLLLGTDPRILLQDADDAGTVSTCIVPGHSYLLTVIDPDRNVSVTARDHVLLSAEVPGGENDVEIFLLEETGKNRGVFRGYIDTQAGLGRTVQGVVEAMPGQEVRFGYVDFADSHGRRNRIFEVRLPVVCSMLRLIAMGGSP